MKINSLTFLFFVLLTNYSCNHGDKIKKEQAHYTTKISPESFAGSSKCKVCHEKEYNDWMGSDHQLAMQKADSASVLGNFNDVHFTSKGVNYHFFKKDSLYFVNTEGDDGKYHNYKIKNTFGYYPLQQYIVQFPKGNEQCLLAAWDSKDNKWFDLQPKLKTNHDEWMHWTGGSMTWNNMCADCHSTFLEKNYSPETKEYHTKYAEINVSCEACHGPAKEHITFYKNLNAGNKSKPPTLFMYNNIQSKELVQKCARCHSRRASVRNVFDYKGHFLDYYYPNLIQIPIYELDGQILDEDYVYGSFMQSKMYHNNVSCKDCHDMHTLKLKKKDNALCLQCHEPEYNTFQHHFHKQNTEASKCVNCHMTGKYYMGNDFRRDHSFRIPRPDQSMKYNTPNACNKCHKDKTAQWASDFIDKKYGNIRRDHFSNLLLPGINGELDSLRKLISLSKYPEIIRATAVNILGKQLQSSQDLDLLKEMLNDLSPMVRKEAVSALAETNNNFSNEIEKRLDDSIRTVRIAAARYFILHNLKPKSKAFKRAKKEYLTELKVNADFASGQHQIALHFTSQGDRAKAKNAYRQALIIDNYFNMSRINLALMEYEDGNIEEAESLYLKVIEQEPEYSYPYFMLGLLYNEKSNNKKSLKYLKKATEKHPPIPNAFYNYVLKLQQTKKYKESLKVLDKALSLFPSNERMLYIKLLGEINTNNKKKARVTCNELIKINPQNNDYKRIMKEITKSP